MTQTRFKEKSEALIDAWKELISPRAWPCSVDEYDLEKLIARALAEVDAEAEGRGYERGKKEACKACNELVLVGTDECTRCQSGRVTLYQQGNYCLECNIALTQKGTKND